MLMPLVVTLLLCSSLATALDNSYIRWKGLIPNPISYQAISVTSNEFTATPTAGGGRVLGDYEDITDALGTTGTKFDWGTAGSPWSIDVFGQSLTSITCYDNGYCDDEAVPAAARDPTAVTPFAAGDVYFAPNWVTDLGVGGKYHMYIQMAESVASGNPGPNEHLRKIVGYIVNTATSTYTARGIWACENLVVVTWRLEIAIGGVDIFQMVLADGGAGNDDYVLFLYDTLEITAAGAIVGVINGNTATESAQICNADPTTLLVQSNRYCSEPAHYVFNVNAASACDSPTVCAAPLEVTDYELDTPNRNCIAAMSPIVDSCSETTFCQVDYNNPLQVKITFRTRWYADLALTAQFMTFDTLIPVPDGGCTVALPASPNRVDTELEQQITIASTGSKCGMDLNSATGDIQYAYKVYFNYNLQSGAGTTVPSVELSEQMDYIVRGTCNYNDLPTSIAHTNAFGDISTTIVPTRARSLEMHFELEEHSKMSSVGTGGAVQLGRKLWASVCFVPGTPFNLYADPYGSYVKNCAIANNADFIHDPANKLFGVEVFDAAGCRLGNGNGNGPDATHAFYFSTNEFVHDAQHQAQTSWVAGGEFCVISGYFHAAKWNHALAADDMLYMRCSVGFCRNFENYDNSSCKQSCTLKDVARRKRSIGDQDEVVQTYIRIVSPEEPESDAKTCVENTVAMATIGSLITAIIVATIGTAVLFVVYNNRKSKLGL